MVTVTVGILGTLLAVLLASCDIRSLFYFFQKVLGLLSSGVVGIFILGIFTRRTSAAAALVGTAALVWVTRFTDLYFFLYATVDIGVTVGTGFLASFLWPQRASIAALTWRGRRPNSARANDV